MNYNNAKQQFEKYLDGYDSNNDKVRLKIIHTYGVVHAMEEICHRMQLSEEDTELARIIALLHDIGRAEQYTNGIPHDEAGVSIAGQILSDLNFTEEEKSQILNAIGEHRSSNENLPILSQIIYEADKKSRNCFLCSAEKECYWAPEKKNMTIQY